MLLVCCLCYYIRPSWVVTQDTSFPLFVAYRIDSYNLICLNLNNRMSHDSSDSLHDAHPDEASNLLT